jgi:hypothetical protein
LKWTGKKGGKCSHEDIKALDRYYKPDEWFELNKKTKDNVTQLRKKRCISEVTSE